MIQVYHLLFMSLLFLIVFAIGELAYRYWKVNAELTRKWSHIGSGLLSLLFPFHFTSLIWVGFICGMFLMILWLSKIFKLLPSINQVNRQTYGSYLFPIAVFIAYWVYEIKGNNLLYFYLPILSLAICDLCAALVGQKWPIKKIKIYQDAKSIGGFIAFTFSSLLINFTLSLTCFEITLEALILIPIISGLVELISPKGFDNITIPVSVIIMLLIFNA